MIDFLYLVVSSNRSENFSKYAYIGSILPESGLWPPGEFSDEISSLRRNEIDWLMSFIPKIIVETSWYFVLDTLSTSISFNQKSFGLGNNI